MHPCKYKPGYWWMSFAGPRPIRFRGVAIVYAESYDQALQKTWDLGINPGGNVLGDVMDGVPNEKWVNRLLSRKLLAEMEMEYPSRGRN